MASTTRARNRHYSLATYILLRGLTLLIRVGNKERNKQRHPTLYAALAPTRIEHGDTLLMCVSCEWPCCRWMVAGAVQRETGLQVHVHVLRVHVHVISRCLAALLV